MQLIHTAFFLAIISFALVSFLSVKDRLHFNPLIAENEAFYPLFPILAVVFTILGFFMFNRQIAGMDTSLSADEKIARYQTAFLIRCAFIEAGALLNTVAFFLVGNTVFLIVVAFSLLAFIIVRPRRQHIIDVLNLQFPDTEKL